MFIFGDHVVAQYLIFFCLNVHVIKKPFLLLDLEERLSPPSSEGTAFYFNSSYISAQPFSLELMPQLMKVAH